MLRVELACANQKEHFFNRLTNLVRLWLRDTPGGGEALEHLKKSGPAETSDLTLPENE